MVNTLDEEFIEQKVAYTLEIDGRFIVVEGVPARVSLHSGERFFSPKTVERLHSIFWSQLAPSRLIETPVYDFAAA